MRLLNLLMILLLMVGCVSGGGAVIVEKRESNQVSMIKEISNKTVALVLNGRVFCTGIWVSRDEILTAYHCIESIASISEGEEISLIGTRVYFSLENEIDDIGRDPSVIHESVVVGYESKYDLGLLRVYSRAIPEHSVIRIASNSLNIGEGVHIVGHVKGLYWTYVRGVVSAYRESLPFTNKEGPFIQVSAPIYYGNSGGGVFNDSGELCGLISFMALAPMTNFIIDKGSVEIFLNLNKHEK